MKTLYRHFDARVASRILCMQSDTPQVSIIIPAYNEELYLAKTFRSLSRLSTSIPLEILLIDNGSTDATSELAKRYNVRVIAKEHGSIQSARALGICAARAEIILQLDADTIVAPEWVDAHVAIHNKFQSVNVVAGMSRIVGVHFLVKFWCWGSYVYRTYLLGQAVGFLYGEGPNLSYKKTAVLILLDKYETLTKQEMEDLQLFRLLSKDGQGILLPLSSKATVRTSGRKYQSIRQAVIFIYASILRKLMRHPQWQTSASVGMSS
jgi:glycosyltransferase involved in cell wall biosynthesis